VMTTLTTICGLIPMAVGLGEGAEANASLAISVIGGLTVSTLLDSRLCFTRFITWLRTGD